MYTETDLNERFIIIRNANLTDATILDENYRQLIAAAYNPDERQQFVILRSTVQGRIKQLSKTLQ
jgi:hypothetical protein